MATAPNRSAFTLDVLTRGAAHAVVVADFRPVSSAPRLAEQLAAAVGQDVRGGARAADRARGADRAGGDAAGAGPGADRGDGPYGLDGADLTICQLDPARDFGRGLDADPRVPLLEEAATGYAEQVRATCRGLDVTIVADCSAAALALRIAAALDPDTAATDSTDGTAGPDSPDSPDSTAVAGAFGDRGGLAGAGGRGEPPRSGNVATAVRRVSTVLLRPAWPDTALVREILDELRAEVRTGLRTPPATATPELDDDPAAALDAALGVLRTDVAALTAQHGIDPHSRTVADLLGRFRGWLGYLVAVREALRTPWTHDLDVRVCTEPGGTAHVPWFGGAAYTVAELHPADGDSWPGSALTRLLLDRSAA